MLKFLTPLFLGLGFIVKLVYNIAFAWWLDPWLQRKANRALWDNVQANLYFLTSQSQVDFSGPTTIHPFDYASLTIPWENLLVIITRGRGDTTVCVAPRHAPRDSYELGPLIAALEQRRFSERDIVNDLAGAATLLRPRLQQLNTAFSEQEFPRTKQLL
ncbi:MAG: hypothetical protein LAN83_10485 [Acidobacteriia bacterium]|nr:hypothetical protein [Terriglobia bacterium]